MATGKTEWREIILHASENAQLAEVLHEKLLEESALYAMIGGMPEIVKTYSQSQDLQQCQELQQIHVTSFREDFHKYASKALKVSQLNFSKQENIIHLPFYALMKIGKASLKEQYS